MSEPKWYIIHAYSNFEKKVAQAIEEMARQKGLSGCIEEIRVPTEEVKKRRRTVEQRWFPSYILIKMHLNDETFHMVKNMPKVSGFLGAEGGRKPMPVKQAEIDRIMGRASEVARRRRPLITFELGERVKVNDGPFQSFEGAVQEVDEDNGRLKVAVSIFGRETPVDLEYEQVEKI